MQTWMIVVLEALALPTAAAIGWVAIGRMPLERLKRRLGAEYALATKRGGNGSRAEAEVASRTKRVDRFDIRPLSANDHGRFADRWRSTQGAFVDNPARAMLEAETLVEEVMRARGYPAGDFDPRDADMSVGHPRFVENYREARGLAVASQRGAAKVEDLKRAVGHFRALFEDLLQTADRGQVELRR